MKEKVAAFIRDRIYFDTIDQDLKTILDAAIKDPGFLTSDRNPLTMVGAEFLWSGAVTPLLDHNYLNERDRADKDTMANVAAMRDTASRLSFVLVEEDSSLLGYWPISGKPSDPKQVMVVLDTEGQYHICEGASLAETLCYRFIVYDNPSQFEEMRSRFAKIGIDVNIKSKDEIYAAMDSLATKLSQHPNVYRNERYEHYKNEA